MIELAVSIALAPTIAIALFIYQKDRYDREPPALLLKLFLFGALTVLPVYYIEKLLSFLNPFTGLLSAFFTAFIVAGMTEEYFKRLVVIRLACRNKSYNEKLDGIVYSVFSALGFATVENLIYVLVRSSDFIYTGITRGIFAVPAHVMFGVTMGYYLSISKFANDERVQNINMRKSYIVPVLLHGIYDFILMSRFMNLFIIFFLFVLYLWRVNLRRLNEYVDDSRARNKGTQ